MSIKLLRFLLVIIGLVSIFFPTAPTNASVHAAPLDSWAVFAHNGMNGPVYAMLQHGSDLYVGGHFSRTQDNQVDKLNGIARWDGSAWHPLDLGLMGEVRAIAFDSAGNLYAVGRIQGTCANNFCGSIGTAFSNIAKWNGTTWSGVGDGVDGDVNTVIVDGSNNVYIGGNFARICTPNCGSGTVVNHVAKWNGTTWSGLGFGLNDQVYTLALDGAGTLYAGGEFYGRCIDAACTFNSSLFVRQIGKWDGSIWSSLPNDGLNGAVNTILVSGSDLYAGGRFTKSGDTTVTNLNHITKLSSNAWSALPNMGLDGDVDALFMDGSDLFVGGAFTQTNDGSVSNLNSIAKLSSGVWSGFPNGGLGGTLDPVKAFGKLNSTLYVGGEFLQSADKTLTLFYITKLGSGCGTPGVPTLSKPGNGKTVNGTQATLKWNAAACADTYTVTVKNNSTGKKADKKTGLTALQYKTKTLAPGTYKWFVQACNINGCTKSATRTFKIQ